MESHHFRFASSASLLNLRSGINPTDRLPASHTFPIKRAGSLLSIQDVFPLFLFKFTLFPFLQLYNDFPHPLLRSCTQHSRNSTIPTKRVGRERCVRWSLQRDSYSNWNCRRTQGKLHPLTVLKRSIAE